MPLYYNSFTFLYKFHLLNVISIMGQVLVQVGRVFTNGPRDLSSIPGQVIPKTQKMIVDTALLNTQHYKVWIKGKMVQSRERSSTLPTPWCSSY